MNNSRKSKLNILTGVLSQVITIAISVLLPRLFITKYGSETNGFISSINSIIVYLSLLEAGVGGATIQALYGSIAREEKNRINGILSATNQFYKKTSLAYASFIVMLSIGYPLVVKSELSFLLQTGIILLVGAGGVLGYLFQAKFRLLLQAEGKQYVVTNIATLVHVITSVGKLILVSLGFSIIWVQVLQFLLVILQIIIYYSYIHRNYPWIDLKTEPDNKAIEQKNSVLVHQIAELIFNHVDVVLLTIIVKDLRVVSVYTLYNMFVDMISTLIGNVNSGFTFRLAQLYSKDQERHKVFFDTYETYYMAFSFALYTVTFIFLHPFMKLYTAGITDTEYLLPLLPALFVLYKTLVVARAACGGLSSYAGHFKQTQMHSVIETSINLVASIVAVVLFQKWWGLGIYGVLIGTIAALLYRANIMILYANKHILFRSSWSTYKKWILDMVIAVVCVYCFSLVAPQMSDYFHLILYAGITCVAVLAVYFLFNTFIYPQNMRFARGILLRRNAH